MVYFNLLLKILDFYQKKNRLYFLLLSDPEEIAILNIYKNKKNLPNNFREMLKRIVILDCFKRKE